MTNFSKSASTSIANAIETVKYLGQSIDEHENLCRQHSNNIDEALSLASIAIENILLCLKQHEDRIKELEGK